MTYIQHSLRSDRKSRVWTENVYDSNASPAAASGLSYAYDALKRPVSRNADTFAYNRRGEVTNAVVAAGATSYAWDGIGNATTVVRNGAPTAYFANSLNQYALPTSYDPNGEYYGQYSPAGELLALTAGRSPR